MRVLSAIAASFGFLYEAFNLGPSLISKVLQSGGTGVWLTGNIFSLAGSDNCAKVVPGICNLLFFFFFISGPGDHIILNRSNLTNSMKSMFHSSCQVTEY